MTRPSTNIDKKLLEAARKLLPETGFTNLSVRMVCRKAGVNPGMFIYYFKTKDQFIERLLSDIYEEFFRKFSLEVKQGENDLERMKQALFLAAVFARENRGLIATLAEDIMLGNHKIAGFVRKHMTKHIVIFWDLLRKCQKQGLIVRMSPLNLLPLIAAPVMGPLIILRLAERHVAVNRGAKILLSKIGAQVLTDKAIRQRIDVIFKGLTP